MPGDKDVQCRLTAATHARLTSLAVELRMKARAKPNAYPPFLTQGKVGLSAVIDYLMFKADGETARKRSYAQRNRPAETAKPRQPERREVARMVDEGCPQAG